MSDYREALELAAENRTPDMVDGQANTILESIPEDRFVTMQSIIDDMETMVITKHQVLRIVNQGVKDGLITKIHNMNDGRRRLYRRKGAMD